ncbi:FAD-dependent monooxygenase [Kurthia sibirica]|uniref:FAD-binding protein n=1 Tax=Kurthia sibirica TaxID=202750 RepID=A0A2U3AQ21_9BACL|nr:FAD-dependent monooxygenase [Kurthia sibirica]PWI26606.1 FAD-binding protein [Kurthia sibirica]GEK32863.1 FAD-dependent oxidoreductase [Kurthia sibirica]
MSSKQVDICVVGAGPGGALLSLLLARQHMSVLLLESHSDIAKAFRGEHLNEEGEAILRAHNLFEAVEEQGLLRMETLEYWHNGEIFKTILPDPTVGHLGIHVPQINLLTAILNEAQKYPNFTLMTSTKVKQLKQDDNGRYCGVKAINQGQELDITSLFVIGADGRFSTIRKEAQLDREVHNHGFDLLWAKIPAPKNWSPSIKMALVGGSQVSLFTQAKGFVQIGWNIEKGSYPTLRKQPFEPFIDLLAQAFPTLADSAKASITSWKDFVVLDVFSSSSKNWSKDGVILIGDAVHTMTPTGAFGLNSSMKDAEILAQLITSEKVSQLELMTCATERKKAVAKLQAIQIEKEQSFADQFVVLA